MTLATSAATVKELRLYSAEREVTRRQTANWETVSAALGRAQLRAAALRGCGQLVFGCAFGAAILVVVRQALDGRAGIGDVVLLIALAAQVGVQVANALGLLTLLHEAQAAPSSGSTNCAPGPPATPGRQEARRRPAGPCRPDG